MSSSVRRAGGIALTRRVAPATPKLGRVGCLSLLGQEEKEGERLCSEAGCPRGDPAVDAQFLCNVQAAFSLLDVCVLLGGKPQAWETF